MDKDTDLHSGSSCSHDHATPPALRWWQRCLVRGLIVPIKGYQLLISPLLGQRCRFWPSCSQYAIEALRLHGPIKGGWLALKRLARCHPFCEGGVDPVPEPAQRKKSKRENNDHY